MSIPIADLLTHLRRHYTDWQIAKDLDCVLVLCGTDEDRAAVEAYAKARRNAPEFRPHLPRHSNAGRVPEELSQPATPVRGCEKCGADIARKRRGTRFCSDWCSQEARRRPVAAKRPIRASKPQVGRGSGS